MIQFDNLDRPKLEGSPLNAQLSLVADAFGNQDELPTRDDFQQAYQQLGLVESGKVSWQELQSAIHKKYLNKEWMGTNAPWATVFLPCIESPTSNPKLYAASLMWLQDQLRAQPSNIKVIPKLIQSNSTGGVVYTQALEPQSWTKTAVILPGDYAGPFHYSEMGLELAAHNVRAITIDDACGAYSTACSDAAGWGCFNSEGFLADRGVVLHNILESWAALTDDTIQNTFLVSHSGGIFPVIGFAMGYPDKAKQLAGLIAMAPGFKLTPRKRFWLRPLTCHDHSADSEPDSDLHLRTLRQHRTIRRNP